jgi:hypothetical protein
LVAAEWFTVVAEQCRPAALFDVDFSAALVIAPCSKAKVPGSVRNDGARRLRGQGVDDDLTAARQRLRVSAMVEDSALMPAWRRYASGFYERAGEELAECATSGQLLILSGVYRVLDGHELIGTYEKILKLTDWPACSSDRSRRPPPAAVVTWWPSRQPPPTTRSCSGTSAGRSHPDGGRFW